MEFLSFILFCIVIVLIYFAITYWYIVVPIIFILITIIIFLFIFKRKKNNFDITIYEKKAVKQTNKDKGNIGEKIVKDAIIGFLDEKNIKYLLYNDLYIPDNIENIKKISQIDHILITQKNIYVIETKWYSLNKNNSLYGDTSEKWLILVNKENDKQIKILNPSYQNKMHIKNLKIFFKNYIDIPELDIKNIVIYKNNFYNKTFFKDQNKYVSYGSYSLSSFLKYIEKQETNIDENNIIITKKIKQQLEKTFELLNEKKEELVIFHKNDKNY